MELFRQCSSIAIRLYSTTDNTCYREWGHVHVIVGSNLEKKITAPIKEKAVFQHDSAARAGQNGNFGESQSRNQ